MMVDLKPCPFCGAKARLHPRYWAGRIHLPAYVDCSECDCALDTTGDHEEADAIAAWNRRAASPSIGRVVKPLEWREVTEDRGDGYVDATGDYDAVSPIGTFYIQCHGSDSLGWEVSLNGVPLADADSPEAAKAAAQADYERRILAAIADGGQS